MGNAKVDFTSAVAEAIFQLCAWQKDHGEDAGSKTAIANLRAASAVIMDLIDAAAMTVGRRAYTDRHDFVLPADKQEQDVAALMRALSRLGVYP